MPPIKIHPEFPFLSGLAGMDPSPDWFTHFYLFNVIKEQGQTYWKSFKIRTYPWDAGTDDGEHYMAPDRDSDPPDVVTRIDVGNTVNDIYLNPARNQVRYVAEWECFLHTCPVEDPECQKADWPPQCDKLRFPECDRSCDVNNDDDCEQCRQKINNEKVYRKDCCLAGFLPKKGGQKECNRRKGTSSAATWSSWSGIVAATSMAIHALL